MALFQSHFRSDALGMQTTVNVILPQQPAGSTRVEYPTLYLLHGRSDDHSIWGRRTNIERYVDGLGLAVVMPEVHRSFYQDMAYGLAYRTYIEKELPALCRQFFPLSSARVDNFIAGLSMGGYGAYYIALRNPDCYAAAASLSGALDITSRKLNEVGKVGVLERNEAIGIFGDLDLMEQHEGNLYEIIRKHKEAGVELPRLYQACGTEDFLYEENVKFRRFLESEDIPHYYTEGPGSHEWGYWDEQIQQVLQWLTCKA